MERRIVVVGDPPAAGGRVLPYDGPKFELYGHRVALIGGRAWCDGCHSVGIIGKAGGSRRPQFISEAALEGDVVVCHCAVPQPLRSTLQTAATYDDFAYGATGREPVPDLAAFKKTVDSVVVHPPEAELTEKICPNMTNREFATLAMQLRDKAVDYITRECLPELARWDKGAQSRAALWFGAATPELRLHLQQGLAACVRVLLGLEPANFVRFVEGGKLASCVMGSALGVDAAVCKPDTATHTIAIGLNFCFFPDNMQIYDTRIVRDGDSKLLVLIHEVTHFDDTFGSFDTWYGTENARNHAHDARASLNADSIAAYVLDVTPKAML